MTDRATVTAVNIRNSAEQYTLRYQGQEYWMVRLDNKFFRADEPYDFAGGTGRPAAMPGASRETLKAVRTEQKIFDALTRASQSMRQRLPAMVRYAATQLAHDAKTQRTEKQYPACTTNCATLPPTLSTGAADTCSKVLTDTLPCDVMIIGGEKVCTHVTTSVQLQHDDLKGARYGEANFQGYTPHTISGLFTFNYQDAEITIERGDVGRKKSKNEHGTCFKVHQSYIVSKDNKFAARLVDLAMRTLNPDPKHTK